MANNYTLFSEMIEGLTPAAAEWVEMVLALQYDKPEDLEKLKKELGLESDNPRFFEELSGWPYFEAELEGAQKCSLWLYSEEGLMDQHLIWFVQALINKFLPSDYVFTANFACTCSKPRVSEFGGYWLVISKDDVKAGNTWDAAKVAAEEMSSLSTGQPM